MAVPLGVFPAVQTALCADRGHVAVRGGRRGCADLLHGPRRRSVVVGRSVDRAGQLRSGTHSGGGVHPDLPARVAGRERGAAEQRHPAEFRHAHSLAGPQARFAPIGRLVRERLCGPHRKPDHADATRRGRGDFSGLRRHHLFGGLSDRCRDPAGRGGSAPRGAADHLARPLRGAGTLDDTPRRPRLEGQFRCPLADHWARGGQLYQHPFGQAVRPSRQ